MVYTANLAAPRSTDPRTVFMLVDSGASDHMVHDCNLLTNLKRLPTPVKIMIADKKNCLVANEMGDMSVDAMN